MIHLPGRIPIFIHPTFWLGAGLIGYWISQSFLGMLIWTAIIFVSVLFHEMGHAVTAFCFGRAPRIDLVALGGLTQYEGGDGKNLSFWRQFLIVLNGPLSGFLLFGCATLLLHFPTFSQGTLGSVVVFFRNVNLFWTIVNLLPVLPMDGGQLLRILLEKFFGVKGLKYTLLVGIVLGVGISLLSFLFQNFFIGALFFLFAFQSYDTLRKTRHFSENDRDEALRSSLQKAEQCIELGKREEAILLCEEIRKKVTQGMIFELATQYIAFLKYEQGAVRETYELLRSIKETLGADALCLLQKAAFEVEDFPLVVDLSATCFQTWPNAETALCNAYAHAYLHQSVPAIGWLQTAKEEGLMDLPQILSDPLFDPFRQDPSFQALFKDSK